MRISLWGNVSNAINETYGGYGWIYLPGYGIRHFKLSRLAVKGQHAEDYAGYPVRW
jgi:hypothetical protein